MGTFFPPAGSNHLTTGIGPSHDVLIALIMTDTLIGPSLVASPDAEFALVAGLRGGDAQAYEDLILRYQQPVYGLVCRLLGGSAEASDITQEVFLKVFRNISSFRERSSLRTWIYRIAVNEAYNHRRWFSRHRRGETDVCCDSHGPTVPGPNPFDLAAGGETRTLVERALARLNPNFRAVVVLRDIEDLSYEEIAAILRISLGTVKSRILRGRESLRSILSADLERPAVSRAPSAEPASAYAWAPHPPDFARNSG